MAFSTIFLDCVLGDSVVFLWAPVLGVLVLAYPGDVVTREIWPRWLVSIEFLTWWCPGLSVLGLTCCGRGLRARWRTSRRRSQGCSGGDVPPAFLLPSA